MSSFADFQFTAIVGIDWSDAKHDVCIQRTGQGEREFGRVAHDPAQIDQWVRGLYERFGGPIAVAVELSKGPVVYALQKYDFLVLFPVNPSMLAKYREAFVPSGAKDDPSDAELAVELVLRHRDRFKPLEPQSTALRQLQQLVEQRRQLVNDRVRFSNRLTSTLKQYYPQAAQWFEHKDTFVFCAFIARWPSLSQVKRARSAVLERFFHEHNVRRPHMVQARIQAIRKATALTEDPAVIVPCSLHVQTLAEQLRVTLDAIKRLDTLIAEFAPTLPDYSLFSALPGAGAVLAPRLMVALGEDRERFASATELQRYCGVAPVTERSGNKSWIHWRWQCSTFVRQTFTEWAEKTIYRSFWAGAYYRQQRAKGASHRVAVRALAFKWTRILYRCWQSRTPYNESTYLEALRRRGSSLLAGKVA